MPKVAGILIETTFGSIVEIILFVVLIVKHKTGSAEDNGTYHIRKDFLHHIEAKVDFAGDEGNLIPIIQAASEPLPSQKRLG